MSLPGLLGFNHLVVNRHITAVVDDHFFSLSTWRPQSRWNWPLQKLKVLHGSNPPSPGSLPPVELKLIAVSACIGMTPELSYSANAIGYRDVWKLLTPKRSRQQSWVFSLLSCGHHLVVLHCTGEKKSVINHYLVLDI